LRIDQSAIRDDWLGRGFSCDIWIDPPGKIWTDFVHDTDELLMLIDGGIELEMDGNILHPKIGDEVLIPAGISYKPLVLRI